MLGFGHVSPLIIPIKFISNDRSNFLLSVCECNVELMTCMTNDDKDQQILKIAHFNRSLLTYREFKYDHACMTHL